MKSYVCIILTVTIFTKNEIICCHIFTINFQIPNQPLVFSTCLHFGKSIEKSPSTILNTSTVHFIHSTFKRCLFCERSSKDLAAPQCRTFCPFLCVCASSRILMRSYPDSDCSYLMLHRKLREKYFQNFNVIF